MKYIHIEVCPEENKNFTILPFLGSTIRGAFGMGLKSTVCINPSYNCKDGFCADKCVYFKFFETPNKTPDYRFDIELNQKNFNFGLFLFNDGIYYYPYILAAIYKMLTDIGIGSARSRFLINSIKVNGINIIKNEGFDISNIEPNEFDLMKIFSKNYAAIIDIDKSFRIIAHTSGNFNADSAASKSNNNLKNALVKSSRVKNGEQQEKELKKIKLEFLTPLRIKQNNYLARAMLGLDELLQAIYFRICEVEGKKRQYLDYKPSYKILSKNIQFEDYSRYSNRQHTKMLFGGLVGYIEIENLDNISYDMFKISEILGIGKSTAFGLGKIHVECL
ncbi:MAG: CRISPR system precrRNA processing endoribonuclease RAMP protein Cas6 [Candidatus Acididesulfobacter guangdongensis]|uniref:CRISPR system precrRNA processing endoribonuclease RAMP protein Cas6 n=1 Tax=Acididesulfobacter guangdongensis TaxID=2597225 RepID=A0A519BIT4_ACIG2|nr:MAG: CRISPR system precrRNA processing endoribonuclease RAMP protein Cas6 [Candidatus Acididesulfobacter guangdongensis]